LTRAGLLGTYVLCEILLVLVICQLPLRLVWDAFI